MKEGLILTLHDSLLIGMLWNTQPAQIQSKSTIAFNCTKISPLDLFLLTQVDTDVQNVHSQ